MNFESNTVKTPSFDIAPPSPEVFPLMKVIPCILTLTPLEITMIFDFSSASKIVLLRFDPYIVKFLLIMTAEPFPA